MWTEVENFVACPGANCLTFLPAVNRLASVGWRVDYTLSSSLLHSVEEPMVHLQLQVVPAPGTLAQPVSMSLSADKFQLLLAGKIGAAEVGAPPGSG